MSINGCTRNRYTLYGNAESALWAHAAQARKDPTTAEIVYHDSCDAWHIVFPRPGRPVHLVDIEAALATQGPWDISLPCEHCGVGAYARSVGIHELNCTRPR